MSTKAQDYRRDQIQKARAKKAKKPKKEKPGDVLLDDAGNPLAHAKRGAEHTSARNISKHAERKASVKLEDSESGKPSRKSSRKSANRTKSASTLEREAQRRHNTPAAKASRAKARTR